MEDKNTSISIKIQLISSDGDVVEISRDSVRACKLIEDIISSSLDDECEMIKQIPFENIKTDILTLLVEFLEYHNLKPIREIRKPLPSNMKLNCIVQPWYYTFVSTHEKELVDLLKASDFLVCTPLYELICAFIANIIRDQSIEKKCEFFGIN